MPRYVLDLRTATRRFPGIGRYAYNLARAMAPRLEPDEHLTLVHDPDAVSDWDLDALRLPGVEIVQVPVSALSWRQGAIGRLLRRHRGDLYHGTHYAGLYRGAGRVVVTVYDTIPLLYPRLVSAPARWHFRCVMPAVLRRARHTIAVSECTRRDVLAHVGVAPERVTVVPLAADPAFCRGPQAGIPARDAGRASGYVLYLGSNKPHKNLVRLIDAWAAIQPQAVPLVIAGPWDPRYPQARHRAAALHLGDSVRFIGRVPEPEVPSLYAGATLVVVPSEYEGFGLPVVEAMAAGTPVACSHAGALPEVAGEAAVMFDPRDAEAIGAALARILSDASLRGELSARGHERARTFSWHRTAAATLAVYRRVVADA
jgi:glycosyltransferase involved in cell wall biosynthesis